MFNSILSLFRSMAHLVVSSSSGKVDNIDQALPPQSPFLPLPSCRHLEIEELVRLILKIASSTQEAQDQLDQHKILKLEHLKDDDGPQHEHVIASVLDHNQNTVRLSISRSKGQLNAAAAKVNKQKEIRPKSFNSSPMALSSFPNSSQDSVSKSTPAMDVVQNIGNLPCDRSRVQTIFEPKHPIPLLQLAIIIETIHDRNTLYHPILHQCYWFSMLVMGVSMSLGGHVQSFSKKSAKGKARICEQKDLEPARLSDSASVDSSGVGEIPIQPGPEGNPYMTVEDLGTAVGSYNGISVVALPPKEILDVALESQRRYKDAVNELETKQSERRAREQQVREDALREAEAKYAEKIADLQRQLLAAGKQA